MSDDNQTFLIFLVVVFAGHSYWTANKPYLDLVKESEGSEYGENYVLRKFGSGQVAVFHGFMDDFEVCEIVRTRLEADGGAYDCVPASSIEAPPKWWQFWK